MDHGCELDECITAKDGVVGVVDVYHIEIYRFCSLCAPFTKRDVDLDFSEGLYPLASEANERVL